MNLKRELNHCHGLGNNHRLSKLLKWQRKRKHYLYTARKMTIFFNTGKMRPKFRVPVTIDKDVPKTYYLSYLFLLPY